jgi:hypothetical protein
MDSGQKYNVPKLDKYTLTLSLTLEAIMLTTYRTESATNNIVYLKNQDPFPCLTVANISEVICTRLFEGKEFGGAIGYLSGCYKRLQLKESGIDENMRPDLARLVIIFPRSIYL